MVLLEDAIKYYASEANCCLTKLIFLTKAACLSLQERQTTFVRMSCTQCSFTTTNSSNYYCNSSMFSQTFVLLCPRKNRRRFYIFHHVPCLCRIVNTTCHGN